MIVSPPHLWFLILPTNYFAEVDVYLALACGMWSLSCRHEWLVFWINWAGRKLNRHLWESERVGVVVVFKDFHLMHPPFVISTSNSSNFDVVVNDWMNVHCPRFPTSDDVLLDSEKSWYWGFSTGSTCCVMSKNRPCLADHHSTTILGPSITVQTFRMWDNDTDHNDSILQQSCALIAKVVAFAGKWHFYTGLGPDYFCCAYQMQHSSFWQLMTSWRKELNWQGWNIGVMNRREEKRVAMSFPFGNRAW